MNRITRQSVALLAAVVTAVPALAHHAWPVDSNKLITVQGKVVDFKWENPHPMITLEVTTANGKQETWQVGGPAIVRMEGKGWTRETVKPGDVITGIGHQFRDGQKIIRLERVKFADGKEISVYGG